MWHAEFVIWYRALEDGQPCSDCRGVFHHSAMEWDHLPGFVKLSDVATLVQKRNRRRVLEELATCDLVCANCHAVRTYERVLV